jgi:hypothetical protein
LRWHMGWFIPIGPLLWEGSIEHSTKVLEAAMSNYKGQIKAGSRSVHRQSPHMQIKCVVTRFGRSVI